MQTAQSSGHRVGGRQRPNPQQESLNHAARSSPSVFLLNPISPRLESGALGQHSLWSLAGWLRWGRWYCGLSYLDLSVRYMLPLVDRRKSDIGLLGHHNWIWKRWRHLVRRPNWDWKRQQFGSFHSGCGWNCDYYSDIYCGLY